MVFRLLRANFESRELTFTFPKMIAKDENAFTVIIGKNGSGKSRLLGQIAKTFRSSDPPRNVIRARVDFSNLTHQRFSLGYSINNETVDLDLFRGVVSSSRDNAVPRPRRVICTSVTPFDKFPIERRPRTNLEDYKSFTENTNYRYLGAKNQLGQYSSRSQLARFIESLFLASEKSPIEVQRLSNVFQYLGYQPRLQVRYGTVLNFDQREQFHSALESIESFRGYVNYRRENQSVRNIRLLEMIISRPDILPRLRKTYELINSRDEYFTSVDLDFRQLPNFSASDVFFDLALLTRFRFISLREANLFKASGTPINIREASSGEQCILVTILGIASEIQHDSLICIDEPEISLHPEWQETYIELLQKSFDDFRGCHFVLATHSPQILAKIDGPHSTVLLMDEGKTQPGKEYAHGQPIFSWLRPSNRQGLRTSIYCEKHLRYIPILE